MPILLICHHYWLPRTWDAHGYFKCGCPVKRLSIVRGNIDLPRFTNTRIDVALKFSQLGPYILVLVVQWWVLKDLT